MSEIADEWTEWLDALYSDAANGTLPAGTALRIGRGGPTVDRSYAQAHARALFGVALQRLVPNLTHDLLTDEAISRCNAWTNARNAPRAMIEEWQDRDIDEMVEYVQGPEFRRLLKIAGDADWRLSELIQAWQQRHNLTDSWLADAARSTMIVAASFKGAGALLSGMWLVLPDSNPAANMVDATLRNWVSTSALRPREFAELQTIIASSTAFDSRTETVDQAVERIRSSFDNWLRPVLQRRADEEFARNDAMKPVMVRSMNSFEWLVRYQVLGTSRSAIAKADGLDHANVSRGVNATADLIGLTLRYEKGGRPRKPRAKTKRVR